MLTLVVVAVLIVAVAVFSVQNATPIAVAFLSWKFEASLAVVILLSFLAGLITGIITLLLMRVRRAAGKRRADADSAGLKPPQ